MAAAAQIVEGMGADIVDVNMGCPVPKIAKHSAGCSLMREPAHAASVIDAMTRAVKIPVTVKMRAGWNDASRNAPELAKRVQDAGAAAVTIHGRTAEQSYRGFADWDLVADVAVGLDIPVLGSGDCVEPQQIIDRMRYQGSGRPGRDRRGAGISGVLVGRGVLRNPWILAQAADIASGRAPREVTMTQRGRFLLDYVELLINERVNETKGFRHVAPGTADLLATNLQPTAARGRERWVINKIRALCSWYSKGFDGGSQFRVRINSCDSIAQLHDIVGEFFFSAPAGARTPVALTDAVAILP
jgi:tRNA-dihydrouridine synthase B